MSATSGTHLGRKPVGEVVAEDYRLGAVFKRFGIDFCCGGGLEVAEACARRGVDLEELTAAIQAARSVGAESTLPDTRGWPPAFLADYIENVHHRYCRETLPVLREFTGKVARVHGTDRPALVEVDRILNALADEMEAHMVSEEEELFPAIRSLDDGAEGDDPGLSDELLARMEDEHETAGGLMAEIRELTQGFRAPASACATWRAAFAKLEEFEADLHRHVHLENNVLFPAVRGEN
jgi:regulator of cell morphogenesis and NO signaling